MDLPWVYGLAAVLLAYLSGSIPTSVWWGRALFGVDVREHGSRNAGATNTPPNPNTQPTSMVQTPKRSRKSSTFFLFVRMYW
ncbi:MAG: glycerol-3-phosphate acyltransferase [Flavobacteriales bacterium]